MRLEALAGKKTRPGTRNPRSNLHFFLPDRANELPFYYRKREVYHRLRLHIPLTLSSLILFQGEGPKETPKVFQIVYGPNQRWVHWSALKKSERWIDHTFDGRLKPRKNYLRLYQACAQRGSSIGTLKSTPFNVTIS